MQGGHVVSSAGSVKTGENDISRVPVSQDSGCVRGAEEWVGWNVFAAGSDTSALVPRRQHGWGIALGARLTGTRPSVSFFCWSPRR